MSELETSDLETCAGRIARNGSLIRDFVLLSITILRKMSTIPAKNNKYMQQSHKNLCDNRCHLVNVILCEKMKKTILL